MPRSYNELAAQMIRERNRHVIKTWKKIVGDLHHLWLRKDISRQRAELSSTNGHNDRWLPEGLLVKMMHLCSVLHLQSFQVQCESHTFGNPTLL